MARGKYGFKRNRRPLTPGTIAVIIVLVLFSAVAVFPFWTMIMMGTYSTADIYTGVKILPGNYFAENLKSLSSIAFGTYYGNSLLVAISPLTSQIISPPRSPASRAGPSFSTSITITCSGGVREGLLRPAGGGAVAHARAGASHCRSHRHCQRAGGERQSSRLLLVPAVRDSGLVRQSLLPSHSTNRGYFCTSVM